MMMMNKRLPMEELRTEYAKARDAVKKFADRYGVTLTTVYRQMKLAGIELRSPTLQERFEEKFTKTPSGCWLWMGAKLPSGYGQFLYEGRPHNPSRIAWLIYRGEFPGQQDVLHKCDTPSCVNPDHLFLGDQSANMVDMIHKGRSRTTKLTVKDIPIIRADTRPASVLARAYGVRRDTIDQVRKGKTWRHVP